MPLAFDLQKIFGQIFGYKPVDYKVKPEDLKNGLNLDSEYGPYYAKDYQGREIFMPLTLGSANGVGGTFFPYTWISVTGSRTIIETPMTERRGTVKEQIHLEDYKFSVKGLFIGHKGEFPETDIVKWRDLVELNKAVECICPLTSLFLMHRERNGTDKVVIKDWQLAENPGVKHVRGFTMELVSDQDFELEIK